MSCNRLIPLDSAASCRSRSKSDYEWDWESLFVWPALVSIDCGILWHDDEQDRGRGRDGGRGWRCWIHRMQKIDVQWVCFLLRLYKIEREREALSGSISSSSVCFLFSAFVFEPRRHQGSRWDHRTCWINHELCDRSKKNIYPPTEELKHFILSKLCVLVNSLSLSHTHTQISLSSQPPCMPIYTPFTPSGSFLLELLQRGWLLQGGMTIEMRASVRGNGGTGSHKQDMTQAKLDTDVRELASGGSALYLLV